MGGLKRQTRVQPGGLDGLPSALAGLGGGSLLDEVLAPAGSGPAFRPSEDHAGLGSLLDLNGYGNPLHDILSMAGQLLR